MENAQDPNAIQQRKEKDPEEWANIRFKKVVQLNLTYICDYIEKTGYLTPSPTNELITRPSTMELLSYCVFFEFFDRASPTNLKLTKQEVKVTGCLLKEGSTFNHQMVIREGLYKRDCDMKIAKFIYLVTGCSTPMTTNWRKWSPPLVNKRSIIEHFISHLQGADLDKSLYHSLLDYRDNLLESDSQRQIKFANSSVIEGFDILEEIVAVIDNVMAEQQESANTEFKTHKNLILEEDHSTADDVVEEANLREAMIKLKNRQSIGQYSPLGTFPLKDSEMIGEMNNRFQCGKLIREEEYLDSARGHSNYSRSGSEIYQQCEEDPIGLRSSGRPLLKERKTCDEFSWLFGTTPPSSLLCSTLKTSFLQPLVQAYVTSNPDSSLSDLRIQALGKWEEIEHQDVMPWLFDAMLKRGSKFKRLSAFSDFQNEVLGLMVQKITSDLYSKQEVALAQIVGLSLVLVLDFFKSDF